MELIKKARLQGPSKGKRSASTHYASRYISAAIPLPRASEPASPLGEAGRSDKRQDGTGTNPPSPTAVQSVSAVKSPTGTTPSAWQPAGNTIVLKPAEQTPLSVLVFATLIEKAGFSPVVINIVNDFGGTAGAALAAHLDVDKIAFTGSTTTGKEVMRLAASNLKAITLETGGKSPLLVFPDADLEQAVKWSHYGIMANQGQVCKATSRILVHESIYEKFTGLFLQQVRTASKVGNPYNTDTFQGPQVSKAQYDWVLSYVDKAKAEGATLSLGGKPSDVAGGKGFFIEPTVFTNVQDSMAIYREEIFGPFAV